MKLFTKIALITAGAFAAIGTICLLIAVSLGLTKDTFIQMVEDGKFQIGIGNDNKIEIFGGLNGWEINFTDDEDIICGTELEGENFVEVVENYTKLDIEYEAGRLEIYCDDVEHIQVQQKNVVGFRVSEDDDTLRIEGGIGIKESNDAVLTIILPRGYVFDEVDMELGAALANIEEMTSGELKIVVGAGEANLNTLCVDSLDLEVGAGEANVVDLQVKKLDIEAGVGKVDVEINGAETDYNYNIECGIGSVEIGDRSFGGLGAERNITNHGAEGEMDIECGIGEVNVTFTKEHHHKECL